MSKSTGNHLSHEMINLRIFDWQTALSPLPLNCVQAAAEVPVHMNQQVATSQYAQIKIQQHKDSLQTALWIFKVAPICIAQELIS